MRTMLITDGSFGSDPTLLKKLEMACRGGIDAIQLREKGALSRDLFLFAKEVRKLTAEWGVSLLVNGRLDLALAIKADGVHLPEHAPLPRTPLRLGRSIHSLESALRAEQEGVDYLLFGPIFPPLSKRYFGTIQGVEKLAELSRKVHVPIIAVGGVAPHNILRLLQAGAKGVAAISSLLHVPDCMDAAAAFQIPFLQKKPKVHGLYSILDSLPVARLVIQGGADIIQFRHKGSYTKKLLNAAREICLLCKSAHIPFIINDRCDIALEVDADGVHLGQTDLPIAAARRILGPNKLIGGSASTMEQAWTLEGLGADYVGFGHIFPTKSKHKDYPPLGTDSIRKVKEKLKIPLVAIGGISEVNARSVVAEGADGIAVFSAISQSSDPLAMTRKLKKEVGL